MIWEEIIDYPHFGLSFWEIRLSYDLGELLPIDFSSIIEIINIIAEVITIIDRVAWSAMEWAVFSLVNISWPRFSFFWETKGIIGHKDLKDISQ